MRVNCKYLRFAMLPVIILLAGCGGLNASRSVSPASFFLPGLLKAEPQKIQPDGSVPARDSVKQVAQLQ